MVLTVEISRSLAFNKIARIAILAKKIKKSLPMHDPYEYTVGIVKAQRPQGNGVMFSWRTMT